MILATRQGNRQAFGAFDSSTPIPRNSQWGGAMSHAGKRVDLMSAAGLPAFLRGLRLICETAAMMPAGVYRGFGSDRTPEPNASQLGVLRRPNDDQSTFDAWAYAFASMLRGNAYLKKVKVRRRVEGLYPLDPGCVKPVYKPGQEPKFEVYAGSVRKTTLTKADLIHIPGILLEHPFIGVSIVQAARHGLGTALARQEFEGRFLANDGTPSVVLKHPANVPQEQRQELRESFEARHSGPSNTGRPALMWGGWELESIAVTMEDAQFVESQQFSVREIALMLGIPSGLLNDPEAPGNQTPEQENMRFLTYGLAPWMTRLEQGLAADRDLFPESDLSVELDPNFLLRADIKTRYEAQRLGRQGGWKTPNEIRVEEGYPPVKGGDEIQITPVGGAENPGLSNGSGDPDRVPEPTA